MMKLVSFQKNMPFLQKEDRAKSRMRRMEET